MKIGPNLFEDYINNDVAETYFPDQPIKISIDKISNSIMLFSINSKQWKLDKGLLIKNLLNGAENFFVKMITYSINENDYYEAELIRIRSLRERITV